LKYTEELKFPLIEVSRILFFRATLEGILSEYVTVFDGLAPNFLVGLLDITLLTALRGMDLFVSKLSK
jgi:hypothetical protein